MRARFPDLKCHQIKKAFLPIFFHSNDNGDDEFVSDSYQASTTDLAEAEDSIKKLGVGGTFSRFA